MPPYSLVAYALKPLRVPTAVHSLHFFPPLKRLCCHSAYVFFFFNDTKHYCVLDLRRLARGADRAEGHSPITSADAAGEERRLLPPSLKCS